MKWRTLLLVFLLTASLTVLFFNTKHLTSFHESRDFNRMINNPDIPLSLSITTFALGPLRALVVDSLWWRAIQQQDKGEYFDALQLADWITKLQPTFASVWAFQGWNMSYNIAHDFANEEDRWQWILRALHLLRDQGLKYNPNNIIIRQEIARIFYDRIGSKVDPGAEYFKNQWAFKMMEYFDEGTREELERLNNAAASLQRLKQRPYVSEYVQEALRKGVDILNFVENPPRQIETDANTNKQPDEYALEEIYYYYKRSKIENDLKLDIGRMLKIDQDYGPLDWRLHQAHTIYWAAEDNFEDFMKGGINYSKIVRQSMIESFYEGRLFHNPVKNVITRTSNLQIIGKIHDYVEYVLHNEYSHSVDMLHKKFLESAIAILYTFNQIELSRELFDHYREDYLKTQSLSYQEFVIQSLKGALLDQKLGKDSSMVEAAVFQSYRWADLGEYDRSNGYYNLAKLMWQRHQNKYQNEPAKLLQPFDHIVKSAKEKFLGSTGVNEKVIDNKLKKAETQQPKDIYIGTFEDHGHEH